jgi:hypothetical protein
MYIELLQTLCDQLMPCFALSQATNCLIVNSLGRTASEPGLVPVGLLGAAAPVVGVEDAVGEVVGEAIEDAAGEVVGEAADGTFGEAVEEATEEAVDEALDEAGEEAFEEAVEEAMANLVEEATAALVEGAAGSTAPPEPPELFTAVVSSPFSMYTPLKNQSSAPAASLPPGRRRTPT